MQIFEDGKNRRCLYNYSLPLSSPFSFFWGGGGGGGGGGLSFFEGNFIYPGFFVSGRLFLCFLTEIDSVGPNGWVAGILGTLIFLIFFGADNAHAQQVQIPQACRRLPLLVSWWQKKNRWNCNGLTLSLSR